MLIFETISCGATNITNCRNKHLPCSFYIRCSDHFDFLLKAVCLPGTYSVIQNGLVPCRECEKDTFQTKKDQNTCFPGDNLFGTIGSL